MYLGRRCDLQSRVTHTALGAVRSVVEALRSNVQSGATASASAPQHIGPISRGLYDDGCRNRLDFVQSTM